MANRNTTVAASAHSPRNMAPATATSMSALMSSDARAERRDRAPRREDAAGHDGDHERRDTPRRAVAPANAHRQPAPSASAGRRPAARRARATPARLAALRARATRACPVSATASTIALVDRSAASYFTCSRCPMTSADTSSMPASGRSRRCRIIASSPQHSPSTRKTDSACTAQRVHDGRRGAAAALIARACADAARRSPRGALLHVAQALPEQADDVAVVERVEHHAPFAPRLDEPQIAQQPQLVRDGRLGHADQRGEVADAQLAVRERVEDPHPRRVAERAERLRQIRRLRPAPMSAAAQLRHPRRVEVDDVAEVGGGAATYERLLICSDYTKVMPVASASSERVPSDSGATTGLNWNGTLGTAEPRRQPASAARTFRSPARCARRPEPRGAGPRRRGR